MRRTTPLLLATLALGCRTNDRPASASPALPATPSVVAPPVAAASSPPPPAGAFADQLYALPLATLEGRETTLGSFRGKTLLVVNTASECGYTPQYKGLESIYETYKDRGFVVLGFPSNDFGAQEPGDAHAIRAFCEKRYGVTFPLFEKVHAKSPDIAPLFRLLTEKSPFPGEVKWNFTKFLVSPSGDVVARFDSKIEPESPEVMKAIEATIKR